MNPVPTSVEIAAWLGCLAFVVTLFNQLAKAKSILSGDKSKTEISPQPISVRMTESFALKEECVGRHDQNVARIHAIERDIEGFRKDKSEELRQASASRAAIYNEIKRVHKDVTDKIESMPNQIVAHLVNSKQLWKT